jgi:hypothetical protein
MTKHHEPLRLAILPAYLASYLYTITAHPPLSVFKGPGIALTTVRMCVLYA